MPLQVWHKDLENVEKLTPLVLELSITKHIMDADINLNMAQKDVILNLESLMLDYLQVLCGITHYGLYSRFSHQYTLEMEND